MVVDRFGEKGNHGGENNGPGLKLTFKCPTGCCAGGGNRWNRKQEKKRNSKRGSNTGIALPMSPPSKRRNPQGNGMGTKKATVAHENGGMMTEKEGGEHHSPKEEKAVGRKPGATRD